MADEKNTMITIQAAESTDESVMRPRNVTTDIAEWLGAIGHPLNTRCGGRGLCRGCQVSVADVDSDSSRTIRACQHSCSELATITAITIPEASMHDATLHGVSAFELSTEAPIHRARSGFGLAIDVGTTTVAATLWDLQTGRCLADGSMANAQRRHGDNVLSRIDFSLAREDAISHLQRALVVDTLIPLLNRLCEQALVEVRQITETCVTGNPVMLHTLAGASLRGMAAYPFTPEFLQEVELDAAAVGLPVSGMLKLLESLGPFVGSDITAGALAAGMLEREGSFLLVDFGTNGEILLKHGQHFWATATAAGPAFEGGRLACGGAAGKGVISSLSREEGSWRWLLVGGGNGKPRALSGAAYIDFIALGAEEGWIGASGRFDRSHPAVAVVETSEPGAAVRVWITKDIYVSEADVAEILQAKAAIGGGIATLLEIAGVEAAALDGVLVAGGFGYHLLPAHALRVGLLPEVSPARIRLIGNSSLGGASMVLLASVSDSLRTLRAQTTVIELNQAENFEDHFTDCLMLAASPG